MPKSNLFVLWVTFLSVLSASSTGFAADAQCESIFADKLRTEAKTLLPTEASYLRLGKGRYVYYRYIPAQTGKPTLILLPGLNRALYEQYEGVQSLEKQGYGLLITATSSHWQSLHALPKQETPYFEQNKEITAADFTAETESLIKQLGIQNPVLVSLSYSSAVAAPSALPKIYVAPLVKPSDSDPQSARAAEAWEYTLSLNPFFGSSLIRQFRDSNYRRYWSSVVDENLAADPKFYGEKINKDLIVDGYISISRSIEGFDLTQIPFEKNTPHSFVLGELESQVRLKGQFTAITQAALAGPTEVILIRQAEHNVAASQPAAYATALHSLLTETSVANLRVAVIDPRKSSEKMEWLSDDKIQALLKHVKAYEDATESANLTAVLGE